METLMFYIHILYCLAGLAAFITFLIMQYYSAAVFGFVTAIVSAIISHIIWLHKRSRLRIWYESNELHQILMLGFGTLTISCSFLVYHTVILVYAYLGNSWHIFLIVNCVWCVIAAHCGVILMYYSNKFLQEDQNNLTQGTE